MAGLGEKILGKSQQRRSLDLSSPRSLQRSVLIDDGLANCRDATTEQLISNGLLLRRKRSNQGVTVYTAWGEALWTASITVRTLSTATFRAGSTSRSIANGTVWTRAA